MHRPRPLPKRRQRGFTLLELMAVVLLMGSFLLLVPASLENLGVQGDLKNTANSLVAALNGARDRAILDAYEVHLELGTFQDEDEEWQYGWRWKFTNVPPPEVTGGVEDEEVDLEALREQRRREREWLYTSWHPTADGVVISGISTRRGTWEKLHEGGRSHPIRYFADGTVETGLAIRLVNEDMETDRRYKTITVTVNALTSEPSWELGEQELPESLPASNFGN